MTEQKLLSGAECFYNQHTPENIFDLQDLEAAVSKVSENYNKIDNPDTKYYKVSNNVTRFLIFVFEN